MSEAQGDEQQLEGETESGAGRALRGAFETRTGERSQEEEPIYTEHGHGRKKRTDAVLRATHERTDKQTFRS